MRTLELTVQRLQGDRHPVTCVERGEPLPLPVRVEGELRLALERPRSEPTARGYGTALGEALFTGPVREAFARALGRSPDGLRVLLAVEDPTLRVLHWERLCAPIDGHWAFVARNDRTPFALDLPSGSDRRFPPLGRSDLQALVVVASPPGLERFRLEPFDEAAAVASVTAALDEAGGLPRRILARLDGAKGRPTLAAIGAELAAGSATLLHVVAHGTTPTSRGEPVVFLEGADGQADPVTATRLIDELQKRRRLPHLAFLCACQTATPESEDALGGLGQRLVRDLGLPAAVAMTDRVSVATAFALSRAFYPRLLAHGEVDRALTEACAALGARPDLSVPALFSRLGGRPLFSDPPDRPPTAIEMEAGLARLDELLRKRAPILRDERFERAADTVRASFGVDGAALDDPRRREIAQATADLDALSGEVAERRFAAVARAEPLPRYDGRCPFPGLAPFEGEFAPFFFGRDPLVAELARRLADHPALAVLGPSGCGKSSVVLAGLAARLRETTPGLPVVVTRPGRTPQESLERALGDAGEGPALLVADQLEELFTHVGAAALRAPYLERLLAFPDEARGRRLVLTMRADFVGDAASCPGLRELLEDHEKLVPPMSATELRAAMEQQAEAVGLRFEADLAATVFEDVEREPGAMPLLQHALRELWERRHGRWLRADEYRAIGGVQRAIAETAEEVYGRLDRNQREWTRTLFLRLTRPDETAATETRRDTRQRVAQSSLVPLGADPERVRALVHRLADRKLLVTGVHPETGEAEVEVAHEALLRHWPRLLEWLEDDRTALRIWKDLGAAAARWEDEGRAPAFLDHRERRLEDAEALALGGRYGLNGNEDDYLAACVALRETARAGAERAAARKRRNRRWLVEGLAVVVAVVSVLAFVAWRNALSARKAWEAAVEQAQHANEAKEQAVAEARRARARFLAAAAERATGDPDGEMSLGLLLAAEGVDLLRRSGAEATTETLAALRLALNNALGSPLDTDGKRVQIAAFGEGDDTLALLLEDGSVAVWRLGDAPGPRPAQTLDCPGHEARPFSTPQPRGDDDFSENFLALAAGGRWVAIRAWAPSAGDLRLWDRQAPDPAASCRDLASILPAGDELWATSVRVVDDWVVAETDGWAFLWDLRAATPFAAGPAVSFEIRELASPDSPRVTVRRRKDGVTFAAVRDGPDLTVHAGSAGGWSVLRSEYRYDAEEVAIDPSGQWVVRIGTAGAVDAPAAVLESLHGHRPPGAAQRSILSSPGAAYCDGILVTSRDGRLEGIDLTENPAPRAVALGMARDGALRPLGCQLSPDRRWLGVRLAAAGGAGPGRGDRESVQFDLQHPEQVVRRDLPTITERELPRVWNAEGRTSLESPAGRWVVAWAQTAPEARVGATSEMDHRASRRTWRPGAPAARPGGTDSAGGDPPPTPARSVRNGDGTLIARLDDGGLLRVSRTAESAAEPQFVGTLPLGALAPLDVGDPDAGPAPATDPRGEWLGALSPDGRWLLAFVRNPEPGRDEVWSDRATLWALPEMGMPFAHEPPGSLAAPYLVIASAFSPDGRWLALSVRYGLDPTFDEYEQAATLLWRVPPTGWPSVRALLDHAWFVDDAPFSPDSRWLGTFRRGGQELVLWDLHASAPGVIPVTLEPLGIYLGLGGPDESDLPRPLLAFDPAGQALIVRNVRDNRTERWSLDPDDWVRVALEAAGRPLRRDEWQRYLPDVDYAPLRLEDFNARSGAAAP